MKNIGLVDKLIRFVVGMSLFGYGVYTQTWWMLIGIIPVFTAVIGSCPAYCLLKVSTKKCCGSCSTEEKK